MKLLSLTVLLLTLLMQPMAWAQDRISLLDDALAARLAEYRESNPHFVYVEVGRTADEDSAVIYAELRDPTTNAVIPGVIDWIVALRTASGWQITLPGDGNYNAAFQALTPMVRQALDDRPYRIQADPTRTRPTQLTNYRFPWADGAWGTVTRSFNVHGRGVIDFDLGGTDVAAAKAGNIVFANDRSAINGYSAGAWWYWNTVIIEHAPHEVSLYGHLEANSIPNWIKAACSPEQIPCSVPVEAGEVIGREGSTGYSTAPHLHVEFGQEFNVVSYPDRLDFDADGDRTEAMRAGYVYAEHNIAFAGYSREDVAGWEYGSLHQASHRAPPPTGVNLVRNGDFGAGTEGWGTSGQLSWNVEAGVLRFLRLNTAEPPAWATFFQDLGYGADANTPFAISLLLGSDSDKTVSVRLRSAAGAQYGEFGCEFSLPAGSPLRRYTVSGRTPSTWAIVRLEIGVNPPDSTPAALADDITVVYQPDLTLETTLCREGD